MTSDRDRLFDLLKEYHSTGQVCAGKEKLLAGLDHDSIEWEPTLEVLEKDLWPRLRKLQGEFNQLILSGKLSKQDIAIAQRVAAEVVDLLKRSSGGMPFRP